MQPIIGFDQERPARLLADYLSSQGIEAGYQFLSENNSHGVCLKDMSQLAQARPMIEAFLTNPNDGKYQQAAWQTEHTTSTMAEDKRRLRIDPSLLDIRQIPFTLLVMVVCLFVFFSSMFFVFRDILFLFPIQPFNELIETNQWWRLIGPVFIHFSVLHLVFNLLGWWVFGSLIEQRMGAITLIVLFLLSGVISNLAQLFVSGPNFGGLSGVVYAVLGFVWWIGLLRPKWGLFLPQSIVGGMLIWLVLGYMDVLWVSMANTAHTVGLLTGCGLAWLIVKRTDANPDRGTS